MTMRDTHLMVARCRTSNACERRRKIWMRTRDYLLVRRERSSAAKSEDNSETKYLHELSDQEERVRTLLRFAITYANIL